MVSPWHDIHVLNGLIEVTLDSVRGYHDSAKLEKDYELKRELEMQAIIRKQVAAELQSEVIRLISKSAQNNEAALGKIRRSFINIKRSIVRTNDRTIQSVDQILAQFEQALNDVELSIPVQYAVGRAYLAVKAGHEEIQEIRQCLEAGHAHVRRAETGVAGNMT